MKLKVYQINNDLDVNNVHFIDYDSVVSNVDRIDPSIYKCVFEGTLDCKNLEDVFILLNTAHPVGYNGYSLSVSDVVEVVGDSEIENGAYYCDNFGFKQLKDFDTSKIEPICGHRMLVLEPHKEPYEMVIPAGLEPLQQAVGGYIECTYPFDDNAFIIGNDEAKLIGLEGNRRICGSIYAGNLLVAADDGCGETMDLTEEQIEKYAAQFKTPDEIPQEEVQNDIGYTIFGFC